MKMPSFMEIKYEGEMFILATEAGLMLAPASVKLPLGLAMLSIANEGNWVPVGVGN